jgi:AcrR family transcriptional regulator
VLSDLRALNQPQRAGGAAFMKMFRRLRQIFDAPELTWLSRGRRTARTHMLLEQLFWASAWLPKYDPEDYPRLRERMYDILIGGMAGEHSVWEPLPIPAAELAPRDRHEMSRETFLLAATRLINSRGYRGASVDKISAELNVTKGSFYHHNDAKDDLVVACFERTFEVMTRVQRLAMGLARRPVDAAFQRRGRARRIPALRPGPVAALGGLGLAARGHPDADGAALEPGLGPLRLDDLRRHRRGLDPPGGCVHRRANAERHPERRGGTRPLGAGGESEGGASGVCPPAPDRHLREVG